MLCPCSPVLTDSCREELRALALEAGAVACGFAEADTLPAEATARYDRWIDAGRHAGMAYMERHADLRRDPRTLLEGARTVMVMAFSYAARQRHPLFADYALGTDYHDALRARADSITAAMRSRHGGETRVCVDTAPLRERHWAVRAGLGFTGLNNQLIIPGFGSKIFLTEILWTVGVPPDAPAPHHASVAEPACAPAQEKLSTPTAPPSTPAAASPTSPSNTAATSPTAPPVLPPDSASTAATSAPTSAHTTALRHLRQRQQPPCPNSPCVRPLKA